MPTYNSDREFTDLVHKNIALPKIYEPLGWKAVVRDHRDAEHADMFFGIDYVFETENGKKSVQERFRERKYERYADFTIRYRRDNNTHSSRRQSEYYKIKADYFVYGITNCSKDNSDMCTDFLKYAVVDMKMIYKKLDDGEILIKDNNENFCEINEDKLICPVKFNRDGSSSFFPIDIPMLVKIWGADLLVSQSGFI
jgi:hypothetical protein